MNAQIQIDFTTSSPINVDKLNKQNKHLYEYLSKGQRINRYLAEKMFGIGNLHSRIPELKKALKEYGIEIKSQFVKVKDRFENEVYVKEYWIEK